MSRSLGLLVIIASCGDQDPGAPDAPIASDTPTVEYDFSCLDDEPPTTAPNPTTISGTIRNREDTQGVPGISVDVILESNLAILGSAVTDATGDYQMSVATGGTAIEISRRLTGAGFVNTRVYGSRIVTGPQLLQNTFLTTSEAAAFEASFGVAADPQRGAIATVIRDCQNTPVVGALIAVSPSATNIGYLDNGVAEPDLARTGSDGIGVAWGVPPGPAMVAVVHGTTTFRTRPVLVEAGGLVLSFRSP
jgi:hypothetical protein